MSSGQYGKRIGIISLNVGEEIIHPIIDSADQMGGVELCLYSMSQSHNAKTIAGRANLWGKHVKLRAYGTISLEHLIKNTDLVFITSAQSFGRVGNTSVDYLKQEKARISDLKRTGKLTKERKDLFKRGEEVYTAIKNSGLECSRDYRILSWLPYNVFIIKRLAEEFKRHGYKGKVGIVSNPQDILNYVFALYSGIHSFGCSHYDTYRADPMYKAHVLAKLKDYGIEDLNPERPIVVVGEHGSTMVIITSHKGFKIIEVDSLGGASRALKGKKPSEIVYDETMKYVETILDERLGISKDTPFVFEEIFNGFTGDGEFELSMLGKLTDFIDRRTIDELCRDDDVNWPGYRKEDMGISIGWIYKMIDWNFIRQDNYQLNPLESKRFIRSYKKLHDLLGILRICEAIYGYAEIPEIATSSTFVEDGALDLDIEVKKAIKRRRHQEPSDDLLEEDKRVKKSIRRNRRAKGRIDRSLTQDMRVKKSMRDRWKRH